MSDKSSMGVSIPCTFDEYRTLKAVLKDITIRSKKSISDEEYVFPQTCYSESTLRDLESFLNNIPE